MSFNPIFKKSKAIEWTAYVLEAVGKAKKYNKPVFLEFKTYRWLEHCGPNWDDHLGYRKKDELKEWMMKCPLKRYEKIIKEKKIVGEKDLININEEIDLEIQEAFSFAKLSHFPSSDALFEDIYA